MSISSIFANQKCIEEWLEASSRTIKKDPRNKAALYIHVALDELCDLYTRTLNKETDINRLAKRHEIFDRFEQAAQTGYPRGMFFEGLARREGFGCKQDAETGKALIQVAGVARNCELALNYLGVSYFKSAPETAVNFFKQATVSGYPQAFKNLGLANLYGIGTKQSFAEAIRCFKKAGYVAQAELALVAEYINRLQSRLRHQENNVVSLEQVSKVVSVAKLGLRK